MARIRWVEESEATGPIGEVYANWFQAHPGRPQIPGILKALSLRPDLLQGMDEISDQLHFSDGHLTIRLKEMIATQVSSLNRCPYCTGSHAFFLSEQDPDPKLHGCLAQADLEGAPLTDPERALLEFVSLVTRDSHKIRDADVEMLRNQGWTEPQIAESVYVAALFAFFNRVANAFGLEDPQFFEEKPAKLGSNHPLDELV
jgi:uncharacterized peroxidase-related enzyme